MPSGVIRYSTATGRVARILRSITPLRSSLRRVVVNDFCVTMAGIQPAAEEIDLPLPLPPASLIEVVQLYEPGVLVETEATAVVD